MYEASHILHRDISPNNIMFYYRTPQCQTAPRDVVGVLCDWDLSKELPDGGIDVAIRDIMDSGDEAPKTKTLTFFM